MQNKETRLFVFHDDNSSFSDFSNEAQDYSRDNFSLELVNAEDYLYIGYNKPINAVYLELETANTNANTLDIEYFEDDGGGSPDFVDIPSFLDETKGFTRNGFITWERNLTDEAKTTINSQEAFWYRIRPSADFSAGTSVRGLNIVFADDQDLKTVVPNILSSNKFLATGQTSHILAHVAARDAIVQDLRNNGKFKVDLNTGRLKDFNEFDLLKISQFREAAKFKALVVIFEDLSDATNDFYSNRAVKFEREYNKSMEMVFANIDLDNDGLQDSFEELAPNNPMVVRR